MATNDRLREILQEIVLIGDRCNGLEVIQDSLAKARNILAEGGMSVDITDNRQAWLIGLGEDYAVAVREERAAEEAYLESKAKRKRIAEDIARIGEYIVDAREAKACFEPPHNH